MRWLLFLLCVAPVAGQPVAAPDTLAAPPGTPAELLIRPERTGWHETSRYADVAAFLEALAARDERLHLGRYGYSLEGRALPLAVWGEVAGSDPSDVFASGKVRVWVQANIHAGEVAGKEAVLRLLRELAAGTHDGWADELVLLFAPIHNADGNERVRLDNRPWQLGPLGGMGQRPNADGLDLNRDQVKLASPEARAFVQALRDYEPHVVLDLHTTDGSFHGYHLTYAPGLHPGSPPAVTRLLRERLLPGVTAALAGEGLSVYHYGNFDGFQRLPRTTDPVWNTFDWRPRFATNYAGLRGHLAILSEAYSYLSFAERVRATERFVESVLDWTAAHPGAVRQAYEAGRALPAVLALQARLVEGEIRPILVGGVDTLRHPATGAALYRRRDAVTPVAMRDRTAFEPTLTAPPAAYLVADTLGRALERVEAHGLTHESFAGACAAARAEAFGVTRVSVSDRPFQQVREVTVAGDWREARVPTSGFRIVRPRDGAQARIAALLLEPESADGLLNWALLPAAEGRDHPVLRLHEQACR